MMDNALTSIDDASIISADFSIISRQTVERMHSDDNRALEPEIKPHDLLTDIERSCADLKSLLLASAQDTNTVSKENGTFENNGSCSTSIRSTVEPPGDPVQRKQTQIMAQLWKTNEQLVKQLVVEKAKNVELDKEKSNLLDRVMELESVVHRLGDNVASRPPNDGAMDLWSVPESIKPAVDTTTTTTTATAQKGQTTEFGSLVNELLEKWHGLELDSKAIIDNAKEQADLDQANEEGYVDLAMNSSMQDLICYTVLELKRCKDAMEELKQKMQKTVIMGSSMISSMHQQKIGSVLVEPSMADSVVSQPPISMESNPPAPDTAIRRHLSDDLKQLTSWAKCSWEASEGNIDPFPFETDGSMVEVAPSVPQSIDETVIKRPISMRDDDDSAPSSFPLQLEQESRRSCPVCDLGFSPAVTQEQFEEHVQKHFDATSGLLKPGQGPNGRMCPVCSQTYSTDDFSQMDFEAHVAGHFGDSMPPNGFVMHSQFECP